MGFQWMVNVGSHEKSIQWCFVKVATPGWLMMKFFRVRMPRRNVHDNFLLLILSGLYKHISHIQVFVIYFFVTPPIELKQGLQKGRKYN
jgi:hypothetical protein